MRIARHHHVPLRCPSVLGSLYGLILLPALSGAVKLYTGVQTERQGKRNMQFGILSGYQSCLPTLSPLCICPEPDGVLQQ